MAQLRRLCYYSPQLLLPIILLFGETTLAYNQNTCCLTAQNQSAFAEPILAPLNCGQKYDASKPPAPNAPVSYDFCKSNCRGIGLSRAKQPGEWAAPLVQFILPSVIFSMTIPRAQHVDFDFIGNPNLPHGRIPISLLKQLWAVVLLLLDTTIWICAIIVCATPMTVSGLYEGLLDCRVLSWLEKQGLQQAKRDFLELLVTVVCGNIHPERAPHHGAGLEPLDELTNELSNTPQPQRQEKLRDCMGSQMGFGSIVGAPVLFYLGAFVYTILDLRNDPSDQDAAISLAFGVEWMIIPHVAIVAGCLLASNNPSTAAAIVGIPPDPRSEKWYHEVMGWGNVYDTRYQTVYMWNRGQNKMRWVKSCSSWKEDDECKKHFDIQWWQWGLCIVIPTFGLISLPALAGAFVAYGTPPIGWGCRSLTFMVYAASQIVLALIAVIDTMVQHRTDVRTRSNSRSWGRWLLFALKSCLMFCSLVSAVGGTLMQIVGVFRNCICYVNAQFWLDISRGKINVASDTREQRNSSNNWIVMGSFATAFMGFCCYLGWWYTRHIRQRFREAVLRA